MAVGESVFYHDPNGFEFCDYSNVNSLKQLDFQISLMRNMAIDDKSLSNVLIIIGIAALFFAGILFYSAPIFSTCLAFLSISSLKLGIEKLLTASRYSSMSVLAERRANKLKAKQISANSV